MSSGHSQNVMEGVRERRTVLVVEDDESLREALCETLEDAGFATASATDGEDALAYLRTHTAPALILLDAWMPRMDGWSFIEVRRSEPDLAGIPVVMISGRGGSSRPAPYIGVEALLAKPIAPDVLIAAVEQYRARGPARRRRQTG